MISIPKNRLQKNLYTNGNGVDGNVLLRYIDTKEIYIGYYNIINNKKYYSGKTFNIFTSKPLELYINRSLNADNIVREGSVPVRNIVNSLPIRYFYKNLTVSKILIKEINKKSYNALANRSSSTYQVFLYDSTIQTIDEADKIMPGLKAFLGS